MDTNLCLVLSPKYLPLFQNKGYLGRFLSTDKEAVWVLLSYGLFTFVYCFTASNTFLYFVSFSEQSMKRKPLVYIKGQFVSFLINSFTFTFLFFQRLICQNYLWSRNTNIRKHAFTLFVINKFTYISIITNWIFSIACRQLLSDGSLKWPTDLFILSMPILIAWEGRNEEDLKFLSRPVQSTLSGFW